MILIVDDRPENIFSLKKTLELNGLEVDTANSGEEALKKILKQSYALIILDVQMPGMDGFEVAEAIAGFGKAKHIPIIFLSAVNTEKRFITKGYTSGGIDYITKPVDPDILILKVRTFYRLYEQTKALNDMQKILMEEIETRKKAQEELNEKITELHTTLESIPQIAFTARSSGEIEYVNERWFQYSTLRHAFPQVYPGDEPIAEKMKRAVASGEQLICEVRLKKLGYDYRYYLLKVMPIMQHDVLVKWVGTFTDIHEQKSANELLEHHVAERTKELLESNKQLESTNYDLQQFASVASHDLKEPLRKIQVFSSIIKERYVPQSDNGMESYIDRIVDSSQRMNGLINDLLSYSRLSMHELFKPTDINEILHYIMQDLEVAIKEKDASISLSAIPQLEVVPGQMRQVFQNIIGNALKFTRPGVPPRIDISAGLVAEKDADAPENTTGQFCRIVISDNGIGFDEKYLDKIFTIFQRLNARETYEGTGIGLAIAKRIIDNHNGLITARSIQGEGSTFIIILPVQHQASANGLEASRKEIHH